jgi:tetratricopeptide (TPR) repeat protein
MVNKIFAAFVACVFVWPALGQGGRDGIKLSQQNAESRSTFGVANEYLAAGAQALLQKNYDEGIRLTNLGLQRRASSSDRAAALSNLCGAYAVKQQHDLAIESCTQSLAIDAENWRAYSNRAYVYFLRKNFDAADADLDKALALNPAAGQMPQIRGMMNERRLRGRVTMEEHQ